MAETALMICARHPQIKIGFAKHRVIINRVALCQRIIEQRLFIIKPRRLMWSKCPCSRVLRSKAFDRGSSSGSARSSGIGAGKSCGGERVTSWLLREGGAEIVLGLAGLAGSRGRLGRGAPKRGDPGGVASR